MSEWFRRFAEVECPELPFYRTLCLGLADDPDLLGLLLVAAPGQWRPNLLLATLHDLVLQHPDEPFARYYGTVGGAFTEGADPMPALRDFVAAHRPDIERLVTTRSTQTNEVNRSCLWTVVVGAVVAEVDRPIAFVEVGASAGLNLAFDRYAVDLGNGVLRGDPASTVQLACAVEGALPALEAPTVVHRIGIDREPVDLADPTERRWLKACIWPEQPIRHERFDASAAMTLANPPVIVADDAVDGIADVVEACPEDAHVVIGHSWVMTYLSRERRAAFASVIDLLGAGRDLTLVSAEGEGVVDWVPLDDAGPEPHTVVGRRRYRNGVRTEARAATCHPHLQWLHWRA